MPVAKKFVSRDTPRFAVCVAAMREDKTGALSNVKRVMRTPTTKSAETKWDVSPKMSVCATGVLTERERQECRAYPQCYFALSAYRPSSPYDDAVRDSKLSQKVCKAKDETIEGVNIITHVNE